MSGRLRSTLQGPGLHRRGRALGRGARGQDPDLFDIEAVEAVEAGEPGLGEAVEAIGAIGLGARALSGFRAVLGRRDREPDTEERLPAAVTGGVLLPQATESFHPTTLAPPVAEAAAEAAAEDEDGVPISLAVVPTDELTEPEPAEELGDRPEPELAGNGWLPVDPRIEQRRLSVVRDASLRRTQLAVAALSVVTVAVVAVLAVHSALFGVRHVRIRGAVHSDLALIAREAGLDSSTPMVDVNGSAIAARLLRLPWVGTVRVTREWPATVRIQITERLPVAIAPAGPAAGGGHWALIDQTGRVLDVGDAPSAGLLLLTGVAPAGPPATQVDAEADAALAVAASLPPDLVQRLATVGPATKLREDPDTDLGLRGGGVVLWGPPDDSANKIVALRTVLARVDLTRIGTIDVRVPDAPTVRRP